MTIIDMTLKNIAQNNILTIDASKFKPANINVPVRILLIYGSLRARSYSRLVVEEAARLLKTMGAEVKIYNPKGLPVYDTEQADNEKVVELRDLMSWSEGQIWCSPEQHGSMTGVLKNQIDWVPLSLGAVRPTQGKTLALMQVSGDSQSFNALNQMRILGRWMRMFTIPNQSSVAKAFKEFDDDGRMKPSAFYNRIVDVVEELVKMTLILRDNKTVLTDRYSERIYNPQALPKYVNAHSNKKCC